MMRAIHTAGLRKPRTIQLIVMLVTLTSLSMASTAVATVKNVSLSEFDSCDQLVTYGESYSQVVQTGSTIEQADPEIDALNQTPNTSSPTPIDTTPTPPVPVQEVQRTVPLTAPSGDVTPSASAESSSQSSGATGSTDSAASAESGGEAKSADGEVSGTNVQEAGVDEPDIVKSDGSYVYSVFNGKLRAVDVRGDSPRSLGALTLDGTTQEILLYGKRVYVVGRLGVKTFLAEVDVSDPEKMRVVRTMTVEGAYITARLNGGTARFVLSSPEESATIAEGAQSASETEDWIPTSTLRTMRTSGRRAIHFPLAECDEVSKTKSFSGLGLLTILTIDLDKGLQTVDTDSLMTNAETVYASNENMYVATRRWIKDDSISGHLTTEIHKFDISKPGVTEYRASGQVPGFLLNQWSLSEYQGHLRVATSENPPWIPQAGSKEESFVTVLDQTADAAGNQRLSVVGKTAGIGHGERVYAVRYLGNLGLVVTAPRVAARVNVCERTTCTRPVRRCPDICDPLFAVDLSDPKQPRTVGELKVPGYSTYLHPVDENTLLGIGEDGTDDGRLLSRTQLSLFDITNPANLSRLHHAAIGELSTSEAEEDHHAFLYWPKKKLAIIPTTVEVGSWGANDRDVRGRFAGAIGFRLDRGAGISEVGRVSHSPLSSPFLDYPVRRAMVSGEKLITVSDIGVKVSDINTLTDRGWAQF